MKERIKLERVIEAIAAIQKTRVLAMAKETNEYTWTIFSFLKIFVKI